MFDTLTPSDLATIRDLAMTRSALAQRSEDIEQARLRAMSVVDAEWSELTRRLQERIAALSRDARSELLALVRLGRGEKAAGMDWSRLNSQARGQDDDDTARGIAETPSLDEHIERGLLALQQLRRG
jgi:hypothetical protein